jgi:hypothetical protein
MTFLQFREKLVKGWVIFIIAIAAFNILSKPYLSNKTYTASIGFGINSNNTQFNQSNTNGQQLTTYGNLLEQFSLYLSSRFSSLEIQSLIAKDIQDGGNLDSENPFYNVTNQSGGFVSLDYKSGDKAKAELFNKQATDAYQKIVQEWNTTSPEIYKIVPMSSFNNAIIENQLPKQFKFLPGIAGFLLGFIMILLIPVKNNNKK